MTLSELDAKLQTLHPAVRERAKEHIRLIEKSGLPIASIVAWESVDAREKLFRMGRQLNEDTQRWEVVDETLILTKSLISWHPFGLAYDVYLGLGERSFYGKMALKAVREFGQSCGMQARLDSQWWQPSHFQLTPSGLRPRDALRTFNRLRSLESLWEQLTRQHPELQ
jgi:hypothetical protein